jgi:hypothetical protein
MMGLTGIWRFYRDGFRSMTLGRTLWAVIAVKVIILFGILKLFFFPDLLKTRFDNDHDRGAFVLRHLLESAPSERSRP